MGILVLASLAVVIGTLVRGDTFGVEPTMAFLVLLGAVIWAADTAIRALRG